MTGNGDSENGEPTPKSLPDHGETLSPVLTAEEWAEVMEQERAVRMQLALEELNCPGFTADWERQRVAQGAVLLGEYFTWEDVKRLRLYEELESKPAEGERVWITQLEFVRSLIDRIEALLPPAALAPTEP